MKLSTAKKITKILLISFFTLLGLFTILFLGAGWYFSDILYKLALNPIRPLGSNDAKILYIEDDTVILERLKPFDNDFSHPGLMGIYWDTGFGHINQIITSDEKKATRVFSLVNGTLFEPGTEVEINCNIYPRDKYNILELSSKEVYYTSKLGKFLAYFVDNLKDIWVILVHGNSMELADTRRMAISFKELGYPSLNISYRNDKNQPHDPSGLMLYGLTEWLDLEGAVRYALDNGAKKVVIFAISMGGSIALNFMYNSMLKSHVTGLILDSPMLNLDKAVDINAKKQILPLIGVPMPQGLTNLAKLIAGIRFNIKMNEMDYLKDISKLKVPVLLFHGTADMVVPVKTSDILAQKRKDLIFRYIRKEGVSHCRLWNYDQILYKKHLQEFLESLY